MSLFAKTAIATLVALGALSSTAPSPSAAGLAGLAETVRYDPHGARICSPLVAVRKAREAGLRHAEIAAITPRRVMVSGRNRYGPDRIVFANLPGCPLLRR